MGKTDMPTGAIAKAIEAPEFPEGCEDVGQMGEMVARGDVRRWDWTTDASAPERRVSHAMCDERVVRCNSF